VKLRSSLEATTFACANFFASPMAFFDHSPVFTKSIVFLPRSRFIGTAEKCIVAPPCRKSTR
jgi:hypothetical protein